MTVEFSQNTIALVYDFDGTLSPEAMQHYGVLPSLNIDPPAFWADVKKKRTNEEAEELLVYMREMINIADQKGVKLDRAVFSDHGSKIQFFEGVTEWFDRINEFVSTISGGDVQCEHYIISSGLKEMIDGCKIAKEFRSIFACEFSYDHYGHPSWPARVISDTSKTQYLFRINKGVLDLNQSINSHTPLNERPIPFDNMIYFGDGDTDVPSMAVVMQNGGHAVAVHQPGEDNQKCQALRQAKRIDFFCEADYRDGSKLDDMVKKTLRVIANRIVLRQSIHNLQPVGPIAP